MIPIHPATPASCMLAGAHAKTEIMAGLHTGLVGGRNLTVPVLRREQRYRYFRANP